MKEEEEETQNVGSLYDSTMESDLWPITYTQYCNSSNKKKRKKEITLSCPNGESMKPLKYYSDITIKFFF